MNKTISNCFTLNCFTDYFVGKINETRGGAMTAKDRMRTFLRYVSDPGYQSGVAEDIGIHQSTVSKVISDVIDRIFEKSPIWIKFPKTINEFTESQEKWALKYLFPYAIGVLDCTHVQIKKVDRFNDEYINRKGYASINEQCTCNSEEIFTSVDAQWPGLVVFTTVEYLKIQKFMLF